MESLYNERKENRSTMMELYNRILDSNDWNVTAAMFEFISKSSVNKTQTTLSDISNKVQKKIMSASDDDFEVFECFHRGKTNINPKVTSGLLKSRHHPINYKNGENCLWNIKVPNGSQLILHFKSFDLEVCSVPNDKCRLNEHIGLIISK